MTWESCFPSIHWLKTTSYWLTLISIFIVLKSVQVYYFHWPYHSKPAIFRHFENWTPFFSHHFCKFDQWVFSGNIYWSLLLGVIVQDAVIPTIILIWKVLQNQADIYIIISYNAYEKCKYRSSHWEIVLGNIYFGLNRYLQEQVAASITISVSIIEY